MQREPGALHARDRARELPLFEAMAARERCPFAVVGVVTDEKQLVLEDGPGGDKPIDMPMDVLLGKPPRMHRKAERKTVTMPALDLGKVDLKAAAFDLMRLPAVASKSFLITIGDRTVGGFTAPDQFIGPWQVPVARPQAFPGGCLVIGRLPVLLSTGRHALVLAGLWMGVQHSQFVFRGLD